MKYKLLLIFLLFLTLKSFSQDSKFSIELNYPILIDKNFIGKNYNGIIDIGGKYKFSNHKTLNLGTSLNLNLLNNINRDYNNNRINIFSIQPRVFTELNIKSINKLRPSIGLGYSFLFYNFSGKNIFSIEDSVITKSGFNFNFGTSYDITDKLYIQIQYDFVKINTNKYPFNAKHFTNLNILKTGIGYNF